MGEVINLRLHRKRRARTERETEAAENRVRFGTSRAEKERVRTQADIEARRLDGHRRTGDEHDEAEN